MPLNLSFFNIIHSCLKRYDNKLLTSSSGPFVPSGLSWVPTAWTLYLKKINGEKISI